MSINDKYKLSLINIMLNIHHMKKSESMNLTQLKSLQHKRFVKLLKHVVRHSEFYKNYYQEYGVNIEKIDQIAIEDLPIIDKKNMFSDWHIFEVLKQNGEPAEYGESGNLIVTNLYNYTQPLIRYRMDDEIIIEGKRCPYGWRFPLFSNIAGREEEFLIFKDSDGNIEFIHPIVFVEFIVGGLEKFQVVQVDKNNLRLNVVIRGDQDSITSRIRIRMEEILKKKKLIDFVGYEINVVDDIPNDPKTGKYRLIIPLKE
ncbi:MAG TPA: hypothetical protein DCG77_17215 [Sphingobacterium sp.]|nr:hypothetical protein [Sphingobacterium sp.]